MKEKLKRWLPIIVLIGITFLVECSSPLCMWKENIFTEYQDQMYSIAHQIRDGYLAYVEVDGHYGPVVYELLGLGYLLTDTHIVHFLTELVLIFITLLAFYNTAKLYTTEVFSILAAGLLGVLGWGDFTLAGPEEIIIPIFAVAGYHIASQLHDGYRGNHTYLLAVESGLIFFAQPGYIFIWAIMIVFFMIYYKITKLEKKQYRRFIASIFEGLITVAVPMCLYLLFFKNAKAFYENVVVYNFEAIGTLADGLFVIISTPWVGALIVFLVLGAVTLVKNGHAQDYVGWLIFSVVVVIVVSIQGGNYLSFRELTKVIYIVPLATVGMICDRFLGLGQYKILE